MTETGKSPPSSIWPDELLARFVTNKDWILVKDQTIDYEAFMPPRDLQLSVTRHIGLSEPQLMQIGRQVAEEVKRPNVGFFGRADLRVENIVAAAVNMQRLLKVESAPLPSNPHHAHVVGWPADRPSRRLFAMDMAKTARFVPLPVG